MYILFSNSNFSDPPPPKSNRTSPPALEGFIFWISKIWFLVESVSTDSQLSTSAFFVQPSPFGNFGGRARQKEKKRRWSVIDSFRISRILCCCLRLKTKNRRRFLEATQTACFECTVVYGLLGELADGRWYTVISDGISHLISHFQSSQNSYIRAALVLTSNFGVRRDHLLRVCRQEVWIECGRNDTI